MYVLDRGWSAQALAQHAPEKARVEIRGAGTLTGAARSEDVETLALAWLRSMAIHLDLASPATFEPLTEHLGASVVAMGEATHGTSDFYTIRHSLLNALARKGRPIVLALEESLARCITVDQVFIGAASHTALAAVREFQMWPYRTQEMVGIIEAIRLQCEAGDVSVRCLGIDIQDYPATLRRLLDFFNAVDAPYANRLEKELWPPTDATVEQASVMLSDIAVQIVSNVAVYDAAESREARVLAQRYIRNLQQFFEMRNAADPIAAEAARDAAMAENVLWMCEAFPGHQIVLWSHNGHIAAGDIDLQFTGMGKYLRAALGEEYCTIAATFHRGEFIALASHENRLQLRVCGADDAMKGAVEDVFSRNDGDVFVVPLHGPTLDGDRALPAWFRLRHAMRLIGAVFDEDRDEHYYVGLTPALNFDYMLFVSRSTPTHVV